VVASATARGMRPESTPRGSPQEFFSLTEYLMSSIAPLASSGRTLFAAALVRERPRIALSLLGTGQVGGALLRQLAEQRGSCSDLQLVGVANSRRCLTDAAGIAPGDALNRLSAEGSRPGLEAPLAALTETSAEVRVIVDATAAPEVAAHHARWLARGVHVVSANKLALGGALDEWQALHAAAEAGGTRYGDAATVGAGLPALSTLRRLTRAGDTLLGLTGVFSGSLSFLFNAYDGRKPFSSLLAEARACGYTEPDPRADLSGRDVARKLLIVARAAGEWLEESDVEVEDLVPAALRQVALDAFLCRLGELDAILEPRRREAAAAGQVLRYLARLRKGGRATVRLEALPPDHPCAQLSGADNLFAFSTRRYHSQPLVVRGPGAGPEVTAQALFADVMDIARAGS
jgi:homoserine dehydrogenase